MIFDFWDSTYLISQRYGVFVAPKTAILSFLYTILTPIDSNLLINVNIVQNLVKFAYKYLNN